MLLLQRLNLEHGLTIVIVTHEADIGLHCQRIVRLNDGLIIKDEMIATPFLAQVQAG
jgi:putative ABC transport system ATP-binding protein